MILPGPKCRIETGNIHRNPSRVFGVRKRFTSIVIDEDSRQKSPTFTYYSRNRMCTGSEPSFYNEKKELIGVKENLSEGVPSINE